MGHFRISTSEVYTIFSRTLILRFQTCVDPYRNRAQKGNASFMFSICFWPLTRPKNAKKSKPFFFRFFILLRRPRAWARGPGPGPGPGLAKKDGNSFFALLSFVSQAQARALGLRRMILFLFQMGIKPLTKGNPYMKGPKRQKDPSIF